MLYSLEQDLGRKVVRTRYTQLGAGHGSGACQPGDGGQRPRHEPIKLTIPSRPLRPVNTKDPHRTLDVNDHIINFLTDHAARGGEAAARGEEGQIGGRHEAAARSVFGGEGQVSRSGGRRAGEQGDCRTNSTPT